jgi:hypothetical protein
MQEVFIVKSGMMKDFVGWEWLNVKVFDSLEKAQAFAKTIEEQIGIQNLGNEEDVEIERMFLE